MPKKQTAAPISMLILAPYLLVLYILQSMVFPHAIILGVKPFIMPIAVAGMALFGGYIPGGVFGVLAGILCDMSFNQPTIQFTIIFALLGLVLGFICDTFLVKSFPSFLFMSLLALVIVSACQIFPMLVFEHFSPAPLIKTALAQTVVSAVFSVPLYYIHRSLYRLM